LFAFILQTTTLSSVFGKICYVHTKVNIREARSKNSRIIATLNPGDMITVDYLKNDWYALFKDGLYNSEEKAIGYIYAPLVKTYPIFECFIEPARTRWDIIYEDLQWKWRPELNVKIINYSALASDTIFFWAEFSKIDKNDKVLSIIHQQVKAYKFPKKYEGCVTFYGPVYETEYCIREFWGSEYRYEWCFMIGPSRTDWWGYAACPSVKAPKLWRKYGDDLPMYFELEYGK
jgi:hypothetical protein